MLGGTVKAGPGRVLAGLGAELYATPAPYIPWAALAVVGHHFDLLRPSAPLAEVPKPAPTEWRDEVKVAEEAKAEAPPDLQQRLGYVFFLE